MRRRVRKEEAGTDARQDDRVRPSEGAVLELVGVADRRSQVDAGKY